jgi:cyclophilin family peptidyl-prolyl cis-trans isomerase
VSKRTRNRQLARLAAQRQMERRRRQRRRQLGTIAVALVVALVGGLVAFYAFRDAGSDAASTTGPTAASGSSGPSGASGSSGPSGATSTSTGKPGEQTGTVRPAPGPDQVACGADAPAAATEPKPQFAAPAQVLDEGTSYTATFRTSCGDIVIDLLADQAPRTVNSFVFLAQQGYFDGTRIHRIDTSIDVLQGGDPTGTGTGGPGYTIPDELTGNESYVPGTLAMANAGPDTGGSQFFLIVGPNGRTLDGSPNYTIFGHVARGLDVAQRIERIPVQDPSAGLNGQQPQQAVYIERVTIRTSA